MQTRPLAHAEQQLTHMADRFDHWCLLSEYVDVEGLRTGAYSKLVDWGGWQTTVRTDGIHDLDFALLSVREIMPPP